MKLVKNRSFEVGAYYIELDGANGSNIFIYKYLGSIGSVSEPSMQILYHTRCTPDADWFFEEYDSSERETPLTWGISVVTKTIYKLNDDEVLKYVVMRAL